MKRNGCVRFANQLNKYVPKHMRFVYGGMVERDGRNRIDTRAAFRGEGRSD